MQHIVLQEVFCFIYSSFGSNDRIDLVDPRSLFRVQSKDAVDFEAAFFILYGHNLVEFVVFDE